MKFFQMVMDRVPNLVFVKDQESRFLYANDALLALYAPDDRHNIVGSKATDIFPAYQAEKFLEEDRKAFEAGQTELVEEITDYTGKIHIFHTRKLAFLDESGEKCLLGIASEITELVERERALSGANAALREFAYSAAHDLQSPLATQVSVLEYLLIDQSSILSSETRGLINRTIDNGMNMFQGIRSYLQLSKLQAQDQLNATEQCDLNLIVQDVQFALSKLITSRQARIYSDRLPQMMGDAAVIRSLFQNIIENSIKYCPPGKTPQITVRHAIADNQLILSFDDNGCGIPAEKRAHIFDAFAQGDIKIGTGLGLALCKKAVEVHGGKLTVDESVYGGARFVAEFPLFPKKTPSAVGGATDQSAFKVNTVELSPQPRASVASQGAARPIK